MGCISALVDTVSTVTVTAAVSSRDSSSPSSSQDGIYGGHGSLPAASKATTMKRNFEPCLMVAAKNSSRTPWRRESSLHGRMKYKDVRVQASSSDDTSGDKGPVKTENVPGWAKPNSEELPPWAQKERPVSQELAQDFPFAVYLIGSTLVAIAAVGSVFEYFNKNPVFGVIYPDSPFYVPILGFFSITGLPTAGFLFYKSIQLANKASEEADKEDGFRR